MDMPHFYVLGDLMQRLGRYKFTRSIAKLFTTASEVVQKTLPQNPCEKEDTTDEDVDDITECDKTTTRTMDLNDEMYVPEETKENTIIECYGYHIESCGPQRFLVHGGTDTESYHSIDADDEYEENYDESFVNTSKHASKNKDTKREISGVTVNPEVIIEFKGTTRIDLESVNNKNRHQDDYASSVKISAENKDNKSEYKVFAENYAKMSEVMFVDNNEKTNLHCGKVLNKEKSKDCSNCKTTSGDESDIDEQTKKVKKQPLLTKRQRMEQRLHRTNILIPMETFLAKKRRVGYISSKQYILYDTYKIEKRTKFQEVFFAYGYEVPSEARFSDKWLAIFNHCSLAQRELIIASLTHTFCWPIPYPIIKYEDMKQSYTKVLRAKRVELEYLRRAMMQNTLPNSDFFAVRLLTLLAFTFMGEGNLGKAIEFLEESRSIAYNLEPCEWTGWLYMGYGFYYVCWGASGGPPDCFEKAAMFLEKAREHFLLDIERGASLRIGSSLVLWWLFLIESETVKIRITKKSYFSIKGSVQQSDVIQRYKSYQDKHTKCCRLLDGFKQESGLVETFPTSMKKADNIMEGYWKNKDLQVQKKEYIVALHRQLVMDLNNNSVPMYIQSMYKNFRLGKIIINADHDKVTEAMEFVKNSSPEVYRLNVVHFVPQKFSPTFLGDKETHPVYSVKALRDEVSGCMFRIGSQLVALSDDDDKKIQTASENGPVLLKDLCEICGHDIYYGSFGGTLINKQNNKLYGTTAKHCLDGRTKEIHKSQVIDKNIYVEVEVEGTKQLKKVSSSKCCGILDSIYIQKQNGAAACFPDGLDIAVFQLDQHIHSEPYCELTQQNEVDKSVTLNLYTEQSSSVIGKQVQKTGAKSWKTEGCIVLVDMDFRVGDKMCQGSFIVCPENQSNCDCFGEEGDSGSWVTDAIKSKTDANVYGYVHMVQVGYSHYRDALESDSHTHDMDKPENMDKVVYPHVTWCLRLDTAMSGLNNTTGWDFDFGIYNHDAEAQFSTHQQHPSSDSSPSKENQISQGADSGYSTGEQHSSPDVSPCKENQILQGAVGGVLLTKGLHQTTKDKSNKAEVITIEKSLKALLVDECVKEDYTSEDDSETELIHIGNTDGGNESDFSFGTQTSVGENDESVCRNMDVSGYPVDSDGEFVN